MAASFMNQNNNADAGNRTGGRNDNWKADAFLNLYVPAKDGSRKKIGFIALKKSRNVDRQLIEHLSEDTEANVAALLDKLELDFNLADANEGAALDL